MKRALFIGGYGLVGSNAVRTLRSFSKDVEILIAGRRPELGEALAKEVGSARTAFFDSEDASTCLAGLGPIDLVVSTISDLDDKVALSALQRGISLSRPVWPETLRDCARFLQSLRAAGVEIKDFVFLRS
jgi:glutamyl-tRNA reductase